MNGCLKTGGQEIVCEVGMMWSGDSPYGKLYMYPQELSYEIHRPDPPNWHRFNTFMRFEPKKFEIPAKLLTLPGKLIYFSLGSIGCSDLGLMRKLIGFLAKSPNRFIVSTGPLDDQLELADNMWGGSFLPQTSILPLMDLVITHGGNNTLTESFYFGNRVLLLPLFTDQLDNGQRVEETGLGLQFHPYHVSQQKLLDGITLILEDKLLGNRMRMISMRIKASNSQARAADLLENIANNNTSKMS